MNLSVSTFTLLCLSLLVACSTTPAPIRTEVQYLKPSSGLLQRCPSPQLVPSKTNQDIISNSLARQSAWDTCNIYHLCLLDWHAAAEIAAEKGEPMREFTCGEWGLIPKNSTTP